MKKLSLQWRITLMTALLIGATCIFMNVLIGYSGSRYMDSIGSYVTGYGDTDKGELSACSCYVTHIVQVTEIRTKENPNFSIPNTKSLIVN